MKRWKVAVSGGLLDGQVVELDALGRRLMGGAKLHADMSMTIQQYDYTGLVPRLRTAFARFTDEYAL